MVAVESLEKTRERLKEGTVKRVLFDALEAAGEGGLNIPALVEAVQVGLDKSAPSASKFGTWSIQSPACAITMIAISLPAPF